MKLLLQNGALVDGPQNAKCSPLLRAAAAGALEACELLVAFGADVNFIDSSFNDRQTPLLKAVARGHEEVASLLLTRGADLEAKDTSGSGVWQLSRDYPSLRRLLLTLGVDGDDDDKPPSASEHRSVEVKTDDFANIDGPFGGCDQKSLDSVVASTSCLQLEKEPPKQPELSSSTLPARTTSEFGIACPLCEKMIIVAQRAPCCRRLVCGRCSQAMRHKGACGLC